MASINEHKIGWELEYDDVPIYKNEVMLKSLLGEFGVIKPDGSVPNGFEIASNIYKMRDFLTPTLSKNWEIMFARIDHTNAKSAANTGMHIHVSRENLSKEDILRINYFVFSSQSLMDAIGGRTANNWCQFDRNSPKHVEGNNGPKYRYLNVGHQGTIEFRFFRAPSTLDAFLRNMQFIISIVAFVKHHDKDTDYFRNKGQNNLIRYVNFVCDNQDSFGNLFAALEINKDKLEKGEIRAEKVLNCDLYETQKVKERLARAIYRYNGGNRAMSVAQLEQLIARIPADKNPKTHEFLERAKERAIKRAVDRIYLNNLPDNGIW